MIDNFSLALTHILLLLVAWRILSRPDLDEDVAAIKTPPQQQSRRWPFGKGGADA